MNKLISVVLLVFLVAGCGKEEKETGLPVYGGTLIQLTEFGGSDPAWSPDGSEVVFANAQNLWLMPAEGGEAQQITSLPGREFNPRWNPVAGKRQIVFVNSGTQGDYKIYTLDLDGGEPVEIYSSGKSLAYPSFTNDGSKVAFVNMLVGNGIKLIPAEGGGEVTEVPNSNGWNKVLCVHASPTKPEICYVEQIDKDTNIWSIPLDGGEPTQWTSYTSTPEHPNVVYYASYSWDGSKIAFLLDTYPYEVVRSILYLTGPGEEPVRLTHTREDGNFQYPSWGPEGKRLVCGHLGQIWILEMKQ